MDPSTLQWLLPAFTIAAAWGGAKQALNGTRERVKEIDRKLDEHVAWEADKYSSLTQRLVAVEVKLEKK